MATVYLYDIPELRAFVTRTIDNYFNLSNIGNSQLDIIEPIKNSTNQYAPIELYLFQNDRDQVDKNVTIYNGTYGPFDPSFTNA